VPERIVVDGSNLATEGRQLPSLAQLEDAVAEVHREMPDAIVTVVVDATFEHRIDPSERPRFEQASLEGEYVHPPAGAVGRGDAFLLRIAEKVDGIVLSNDSFQEFHGEHPWLFERGRLLGAMPVPGVGWIFVPRTPVRGARSRVAVQESTRARAAVEKAIAQATEEAVSGEAEEPATETRPRRTPSTAQAVNDPMTFISFIAEHRLGAEVEGTVESFTSHGAVVMLGAVRCYVPLAGLGDPPPKSAREVLRKGETRTFVLTALDPHRRGVELALPGTAISGRPSEETVQAEVRMARAASRRSEAPADGAAAAAPRAPRRRRSASSNGSSAPANTAAPEPPPEPAAPTRPAAPRRRSRAATKPAAESAPVTPAAEQAPTPRRRIGLRRAQRTPATDAGGSE
jgi:hypothetical protein